MKRSESFIEGPILGPLLRFTFPILLALLLQAMYGAVDLMVVGRFGQPADVSAVSTGSQVMHTVTSLITGLSMGPPSCWARNWERADQRRAERSWAAPSPCLPPWP